MSYARLLHHPPPLLPPLHPPHLVSSHSPPSIPNSSSPPITHQPHISSDITSVRHIATFHHSDVYAELLNHRPFSASQNAIYYGASTYCVAHFNLYSATHSSGHSAALVRTMYLHSCMQYMVFCV